MSDIDKIKQFLRQNAKLVWGILAFIAADYLFLNWIIAEAKPTLTSIGALVISVGTLYLFYQRIKYQGEQVRLQIEQINIQIAKEIDDRFNAAINLLASTETSARTGAIYSLYHLAMQQEKYRTESFQILCSRIRSKTQEKEYRQEHGKLPSNEIQTAINLLFKNQRDLKGLYPTHQSTLPAADLSRAHLVGANFTGAHCQKTIFTNANVQDVEFNSADCRYADFDQAAFQNASFMQANCRYARFSLAKCQKANFITATCQNANFFMAQCQNVLFTGANCQKANFRLANCSNAKFLLAECQQAIFWNADCQQTVFSEAKCQKANFRQAKNLDSAIFPGADIAEAAFDDNKTPSTKRSSE